jgi:hypothetical protein
MANEAIERAVDDLIAKGRVQRELRDEYIRHFEGNLQSDLLRGADYTNKTKQLADEKRAYEQKLQQEYQKLQSDRARLEQWQNQVQGELSKLDALPEMAAKLAAYEQALKDYQIYDQVQVPQIPRSTAPNYSTPPRQDQQQQQQSGRFMTVETAGAALRDFALLQSKVSRVQAQHMKLFGEPLEDDLVGHYLDTGEDPEQHWRIKYAVDTKRQQIFEANRLAEMAKLKEEMRAELMKEFAMDPSRVTGSPFGKPQNGLTPLLENYSQSRALAHAQPHAHDKAPAPGSTEFVPPEKRSELAMSRDRVAKATEMFNQHFDVNGNPTTDQGRKFSQVYKSD